MKYLSKFSSLNTKSFLTSNFHQDSINLYKAGNIWTATNERINKTPVAIPDFQLQKILYRTPLEIRSTTMENRVCRLRKIGRRPPTRFVSLIKRSKGHRDFCQDVRRRASLTDGILPASELSHWPTSASSRVTRWFRWLRIGQEWHGSYYGV